MGRIDSTMGQHATIISRCVSQDLLDAALDWTQLALQDHRQGLQNYAYGFTLLTKAERGRPDPPTKLRPPVRFRMRLSTCASRAALVTKLCVCTSLLTTVLFSAKASAESAVN